MFSKILNIQGWCKEKKRRIYQSISGESLDYRLMRITSKKKQEIDRDRRIEQFKDILQDVVRIPFHPVAKANQ